MDLNKEPFLCIITPIFDLALESIKLLLQALQQQSYQNFIHVMISNGPSPEIQNLIKQAELLDSKFIYDEILGQDTSHIESLMANLGKRREYCLKKYNAERYLFLDADLKILAQDYFAKLYEAHHRTGSDILITEVVNKGTIYPTNRSALNLGTYDISNYSFSKKLAKTYKYPTDFNPQFGISNDWRFFEQIKTNSASFLFFLSAEKDGNSTYKNISSLFLEKSLVPWKNN